MRAACWLGGVIGVLVFGRTSADTLEVRPDGTGAFPTIQTAVTAAQPGDIVELTDGVFLGSGNRDVAVPNKQIIIRSQSGIASACVIDCEGSPATQHRAFIFNDVGPSIVLLDGLTIRGGHADIGGGILIQGVPPTIDNCVFEGNTAGSGGGIATDGSPMGTLRVLDTVFVGNRAFDVGGGVAAFASLPAEFARCTVFANRAESEDGGPAYGAGLAFVDAYGGGANVIRECVITGNLVVGFGGGINGSTAWLRVESTTISGNRSIGGFGGGFSCTGQPSYCTMTRTVAWGNCAVEGGDVWVGDDGQVHFECCALRPAEVEGDGIIDYISDNLFVDPRFCGPVACEVAPTTDGDYTLGSDSPCLPGQHPDGADCGLIGALDQGCKATPIEVSSWGRVKDLYRPH